ncbi:aldolase [Metabacillus arenae]|uniref:Aldolase n=1 Tax=Metabacillus arenae TaxID=2771434 RepID=A0A926RUR5_9BACI|nr:aldolase [Metabacillus arenae]MBD1378843.1 aldolase [Metabacillus arenae]
MKVKTAYKIYHTFGFTIRSEMMFPELVIPDSKTKRDQIGEISVEEADLSKRWSELAGTNQSFIASGNSVLFRVPNTAVFCVEDGKRILYSPFIGVDENKLRLYILGSCMGILLMQRKILPLHGSVIKMNGKAIAIIGESGAGKSTLASAFIRYGYKLLTDDVIAVSFSNENLPMVTASYPQQKLWEESLNQFGMNVSQYRPLFERETKYAVPVRSNFYSEPLPLAGVFELIKTDKDQIGIQPINKLERLRTLYTHTYRNFLIPKLGLMNWHFQTAANLSNQIEMYQLQRPLTGFTAPQLVDLVLNTIKEEAKG